ncbi:DUF4302 domain-containing protein [Tenacibaculum ovolyticum]|uniref:DUF4302 domain-containing protein n=1 Tax=Tenacibaculum ovolyticum TaxID=104270 RepID=UPI001F468325|nr:DUF4302 domain-containing protein [Tenacibaculum ovolyticum]
MRKHITKMLALLALSLFTIACSETNFESKFNDSSDERLKTSIDDYSNLLSSSDKGWLLEYYPESNQVYGGFNYAIKFEDGKVSKVSYELADNLSETESSTYDIIALGGPVLTFNTYNKFMHEFATPSGSSYQAKKGDYEFYLTSKSDNTITLKGVRSGNTIRMIKLEETPEEYLTKVKDISSKMSILYGIAINGESYQVGLGNRHIVFSVAGEDDVNMAYNYTSIGIKLYEPITIAGSEVSEFTFDEVQNKLTSLDGKIVIDLVKAPFNIHQDWNIDTTNFSDFSSDFFDKYVEIYNANVTAYGEDLQRTIFFGNRTINGVNSPGIVFQSRSSPIQVWTTQQKLVFSLISGDSELAITKGSQGLNWSFYTHLDPLVDYIINNAPYTIEQSTQKEAKLTSTVDPNAWFILKQ